MSKLVPKNDFQDLERLYRDRGEEEVNYLEHRPPTPAWKRLLVIAFFVIAAASLAVWAGFYAFGSWQQAQSEGLELGVHVSEAVPAGETFAYQISLANHGQDSMQDIRLRVNYPEGFIWKQATLSPEGETRNTWLIPTLAPGEPKQIEIEGILLGEPGSLQTIFATVSYHVPNFRSELQTSASTSTRLDPSLVRLEWQAPTQAPPDANTEYKIRYTYDGPSTLPESFLEVLVPDNFTVTSVEPKGEKENEPRWKVPELTKGVSAEVVFSGRWSKETNGEQTMKALLRGANSPASIVTAEAKTIVSGGDVVVQLTGNGLEAPEAIPLGGSVAWELTYENTGSHTLSDIEVQVRYDGDLVDWSRVSLTDGGRVDQGIVRWTSATTPTLEKLLPGGKGTFRWSTPLTAIAGSQVATWTITANPSLVHHKLDEARVDQTYAGAAVSVAVNTPLTVQVEARYFDETGAPVGQGPLPPKVGTATTYRVRWTLSGVVHRLKDVVVKATLPDQVLAQANSGIVSFGGLNIVNPKAPEWRLETLEAGLTPTAEFSIILTPTSADLGRILVLSGRTTATGTDDITRGAISVVGTTATTNLDTDAVAKGKGIVEK